MTLIQFSQSVVPIISLMFSALGVLSVVLLYLQIARTDRWHRLESKHNFIDTTNVQEVNREMNKLLARLGIHDLPKDHLLPFSPEVIDKIEKDGHDATWLVDMHLNDLQNLCASYRFGMIETQIFQAIHAGRILYWYRRLQSYVEKKKVDYDDPQLWDDFLAVGKELHEKRSMHVQVAAPNHTLEQASGTSGSRTFRERRSSAGLTDSKWETPMNFGDWIPQFFYDLIARVSPGALLLGVTLMLFDTVSVDSPTRQLLIAGAAISTPVLFVGGFIASYTVGMLLNGVGYLIPDKLWRRTSSLLASKHIVPEGREHLRTEVSYRYDFIQMRSPPVGARLAKLSAERGLCRVLFSGFLLLACAYLFFHPTTHTWGAAVRIEIGLLGASAASFLLYKHLLLRSEESIRNNWVLLNDPPLNP